MERYQSTTGSRPGNPPDWDLLCLVGTRLNLDPPAQVALLPGHIVRRASTDEISQIREALEAFHGTAIATTICAWFEADYQIVDANKGKSAKRHPLPPADWYYYVLEVSNAPDPHSGPSCIQEASSILDIELELPLKLYPTGASSYGGYRTLADRMFDFIYNPVQTLDPEYAKALSMTIDNIKRTATTHPQLTDSIAMFNQARKLVDHPPLRTLGMFAVIERLITHKQAHNYDSLTYQIRTKAHLLSDLMDRPIDYSAFGGVPPKKLWQLLYGYRSQIAHGRKIDFTSRELKPLKSAGIVDSFLQSVAKAILRHAVKDPMFISNLREC